MKWDGQTTELRFDHLFLRFFRHKFKPLLILYNKTNVRHCGESLSKPNAIMLFGSVWNGQCDMMGMYITIELSEIELQNSKEPTMWQQAIKCSLCVAAEVLETPKALNKCWRASLVSMTQAARHTYCCQSSFAASNSWTWPITAAMFCDTLSVCCTPIQSLDTDTLQRSTSLALIK